MGSNNSKDFYDIIVEEVTKGSIRSGQIGPKTWAKILEELQGKSKRKNLMKQVKQKFNRLCTKYREFSELLKQTSFGWDQKTNT